MSTSSVQVGSVFSLSTIFENRKNQIIVESEKRLVFNFDYVLGPETTQQEVYVNAVENLVEKFLEGYNVTILAYGQTSSGKTHTMGTADSPLVPAESKGLIPRAMSTLFSSINSVNYANRKYTLTVSFIEIYNEELIDLLGEEVGENRPQVTIREDSKGNILWSGLHEFQVNTRGSLNRQVGATDMNAKSSRSHAIFSVTMTQQKFIPNNNNNMPLSPSTPPPGIRSNTPSKLFGPPSRANSRLGGKFDDGEWVTLTSKFHFVDLAGSERLKKTAASGERAKEGISINAGLSALGNVISALGDPNKAKHTTHIPYRDSKLTRLLQDSLGGNAQTLMIACISPAAFNLNETVNTLKYANRARNIKNLATVNQEETGWNDVSHLQNLVVKLRAENASLKSNLSNVQHGGYYSGTNTPGNVSPAPAGRITPNAAMSGRDTPSRLKQSSTGIPLPGRATPTLGTGRETPTRLLQRPSSPLSTFHSNGAVGKFIKLTETEVQDYEKSISSLESKLAMTYAALSHSETLIKEHESKLDESDKLSKHNRSLIDSLQNYIKDLEGKLQKHGNDGGGDSKSVSKEEHPEKFISETVRLLEKRLEEKEEAYKKLEEKFKRVEIDQDKKVLYQQIDDRDRRISDLDNRLNLLNDELESKLLKLQKSYDEVLNTKNSDVDEKKTRNFKDLELNLTELQKNYESILMELETTKSNLNKSQLENQALQRQFNDNISTASTPLTPMTPSTPMTPLNDESNLKKNSNISDINNNNSNSIPLSKTVFHRKAKSLSSDINRIDKQELEYMSIIEKLQFELQLFESFHKDKSQSLDAVKRELTRLEQSYHETLQLVDELREELKKRDGLANFELTNSLDKKEFVSTSTSTSSGRQLQLAKQKEEEAVRKSSFIDTNIKEKYENQIKGLQSQIKELKEQQNKDAIIYQEVSKTHEKNIRDLTILQEKIVILQADISTKDQTIADLLLPNSEHENTIKLLEKNLHEVKEAHRLAIQEKNNRVNRTSSDKLEQNIDENVSVLEDSEIDNLTQKTVGKLEEQLVILQKEITNSPDTIETSHNQKELVTLLLSHLETLKSDIKRKNDFIRRLKNDLLDQNKLKEKLSDKENHLITLSNQLKDARIKDLDMQRRLQELQLQLENSESSKIALLQTELEMIRKEFNDVKGKEAFALERLRLLDVEESKLQKDLENLRNIEINQRERIVELENQVKEQGGQVDENLNNLRNELASVKKTEMIKDRENMLVEVQSSTNKDELELIKRLNEEIELLQVEKSEQSSKIQTFESRLKHVQEDPNTVNLKNELTELKLQEKKLQAKVAELENQLILVEKKSESLQAMKDELVKLKELETDQKTTIEQLNLQLQDTKDAKETVIREWESMKENFCAQTKLVVKLENGLKILMEELNLVKDNHTETLKDIESLAEFLNTTLAQQGEDKKKIASLEEEIEVMKAGGKVADSNFYNLREELANTKLVMESQNALLDKLGDQLMNIEKERNRLLENVDELNKVIEEKVQKEKEAILSFETNVKDLEKKLEEEIKNSKSYQETVKNLEEKLSKMQSQLDEARLSDEKRAKMVNEFKMVLKEANDALVEKERLIASKDSLLTELDSSIKKLNSQLDLTTSSESERVSKLQEQLCDIEEQLKTTKIFANEQLERVKELEKQIEEIEEQKLEQLNKLNSELEETKSIEASKTMLISELEKQIEEIEEHQLAQLNKLNSELEETKSIEASKTTLINELEKQIREIEEHQLAQLNKLNSELEETKFIEASKTVLINELESTLKENQEKIKMLDDSLSGAKAELEKVKKSEIEQTELVQALEKQLQEVDDNRNEELIKLKEAHIELEKMKEDCTNLENEKDIVNDEKTKLTNDYNEKMNKVEEEINGYREKMEELNKQNEKLEFEKKQELEKNVNLEIKIENLQNEFDKLTKEFLEVSVEYQELEKLAQEYKDHITQLEVKSVTNTMTIEKLSAATKDLQQTNSDLNSKIVEVEDCALILTNKIKNLESELDVLKSIEDVETVEKLKENIKQLEVQKLGLEEANESFMEEQKKVDLKIDSLLVQLKSAGNHGSQSAIYLAELNEKLLVLEDQIKNLKRRSIINLKGEIKNGNDDDGSTPENSLTCNHNKLINGLNEKISLLEEVNGEKSSMIETLKDSLDDNQTMLEEAREKLDELRQEKTRLEERITSLESQLEQTTEQYEKVKNFIEEKRNMESALEQERRSKKNVEVALAQLENQLEELQIAKRSKFMCF
ncbi:1815_t:CDS:10 [Entrophospora sp. SA101]|nr:1815_t:CDS:10 [Entrophospora sp. SA101]CAJ0905197.1 10992_t:CDS:10 [Entrophospora sp. SA101]